MDALCVTSIKATSIILQSPQNKYNSRRLQGTKLGKNEREQHPPCRALKGLGVGEKLTEDAHTQGSLEAANICLPKTLATVMPKDCAFSFAVFVRLQQ